MTKKKGRPIGEKIKKIRSEKNFSQDTLSKRSGLAYHTIAKLETGETLDPRISTVQKIALTLEVSLDELVK